MSEEEYPMPICPECMAGDVDTCEHPPMNGCPSGFPCIFPFECRNADIYREKPVCLGSKATRERIGCTGHQIAWYPDGLPSDEEDDSP
jgi:hypothetical protein